MVSLSVTTAYAIKALACLARGDGVPQHVSDIAQSSGIPRPYLAKILNALTRRGLAKAKRGYRGGVTLNGSATGISLLQVVEAVEGEQWLGPCLLGMTACDAVHCCPTHGFWIRICEEMRHELARLTVADVMHCVPVMPPRAEIQGAGSEQSQHEVNKPEKST